MVQVIIFNLIMNCLINIRVLPVYFLKYAICTSKNEEEVATVVVVAAAVLISDLLDLKLSQNYFLKPP